MKFRLMMGSHQDSCPVTKKERNFKANDVIETNQNLLLLNGNGMTPKFLLLESAPLAATSLGPITAEEAALRGFALNVGAATVAAVPPSPTPAEAAKAGFDTIHTDSGKTPPPPKLTAESLSMMSVRQLQDVAAEDEIDLKGATKKDDILRILKTAFGV